MQASLAARPTALRPARSVAPRRAASVVVRAAPVRGCRGRSELVPRSRGGGRKQSFLLSFSRDRREEKKKRDASQAKSESVGSDQLGEPSLSSKLCRLFTPAAAAACSQVSSCSSRLARRAQCREIALTREKRSDAKRERQKDNQEQSVLSSAAGSQQQQQNSFFSTSHPPLFFPQTQTQTLFFPQTQTQTNTHTHNANRPPRTSASPSRRPPSSSPPRPPSPTSRPPGTRSRRSPPRRPAPSSS